jgi:hypothetical protein
MAQAHAWTSPCSSSEVAAKKRPAMGSYIGFAVLTGILIRGIMTGARG